MVMTMCDSDEDVLRFKLAFEIPPLYLKQFMEDREDPEAPLTAKEVGDFIRSEMEYAAETLFETMIDAAATYWTETGECPFTGYISTEIGECMDNLRIG